MELYVSKAKMRIKNISLFFELLLITSFSSLLFFSSFPRKISTPPKIFFLKNQSETNISPDENVLKRRWKWHLKWWKNIRRLFYYHNTDNFHITMKETLMVLLFSSLRFFRKNQNWFCVLMTIENYHPTIFCLSLTMSWK